MGTVVKSHDMRLGNLRALDPFEGITPRHIELNGPAMATSLLAEEAGSKTADAFARRPGNKTHYKIAHVATTVVLGSLYPTFFD